MAAPSPPGRRMYRSPDPARTARIGKTVVLAVVFERSGANLSGGWCGVGRFGIRRARKGPRGRSPRLGAVAATDTFGRAPVVFGHGGSKTFLGWCGAGRFGASRLVAVDDALGQSLAGWSPRDGAVTAPVIFGLAPVVFDRNCNGLFSGWSGAGRFVACRLVTADDARRGGCSARGRGVAPRAAPRADAHMVKAGAPLSTRLDCHGGQTPGAARSRVQGREYPVVLQW